jgi:DNA-binding SARP family transcriptional activator/class 3 adenylate cyclase
MSRLALFLLGAPCAERDGDAVKFARRKVLALLAYLAMKSGGHSRDALAELLYGREDREHARANLRPLLSCLGGSIGAACLMVERGTVRLEAGRGLWVDVARYRHLLEKGREADRHGNTEAARSMLAQAAALYRGDFLQGFYLADCPAFEEWQLEEQESLREEQAAALRRLVVIYAEQRRYAEAISCGRQWLVLDPLEETAHRELMRLHGLAGQRAAALRQYHRCAAVLARELGEKPGEETERLRAQLISRTLLTGSGEGGAQASPTMPTLESSFEAMRRSLPPAMGEALAVPTDGESRFASVLILESKNRDAARPGQGGEVPAEAARGALTVVIEAVSRYEGRVGGFFGDTVLAFFGIPKGHEDDPQRAVLAALEIRDASRRHGLKTAAGIASGEVAFRPAAAVPVATGVHRFTDPVVETAARLLTEASAGEILVGESTFRLVRHSFETSPRRIANAGNDGAAGAHRIKGRRPRMEKVRGLEGMRTELIGRDAEYALLEESLNDVMRGNGRIVSIVGEAGVGKSRLVSELKRRARFPASVSRAPLWLEGCCMELGARVAYWPFVDMLGQHFAAGAGGGERDLARRVADALDGLRSRGAITAERAGEMGPLLGKLLSISFGSEWDRKLAGVQPEQLKFQMFLAVRDLILALAEGGPVVAVLEDLQWSDPLSIDLICLLMESLTSAALLLVCVYRPEHRERCCRLRSIASKKCPERSVQITLGELGPPESRRLIDAMLSADALPAEARDAILAQSQGNPFFVEEIIRSLIDTGAVFREGGRWKAKPDLRSSRVPATLQAVILGRVDRLDAELRHMLQSASVIGRTFRRRVLELAAEKHQAMDEALTRLEERALISAQACAAGDEYSFHHALTQQAVYQSIRRGRRGRLHERTAEAMEALYNESLHEYCAQLAYHHEKAGNTGKAIEYLLIAGERAGDAYMNDEAVDLFGRALELLDSSGDPQDRRRLRALTLMGKAYEVIGKHSQAEARLRQAAELGRRIGVPARELAQILYLLCKSLSSGHDPRAYLPLAREGVTLLADDLQSAEALHMEMVLAYACFDAGDFTRVGEFAARRGESIRHLPYSPEIANMAAFVTLIHLVNRDETQAIGWLEWLEREAREHNDMMCVAATFIRRGRDMHARHGDLADAVAMIEKAIEIYTGLGARYLEARARLCLGDVCYRFGLLSRAEEQSALAASICGELEKHHHLSVESELLKGQLSLSRGDFLAALAAFRAALDLAPGEQWECYLRLLIGRTLALRGERREASGYFRDLLESAPVFRLPPAFFLVANPGLIVSFLEDCCGRGEELRSACTTLVAKTPHVDGGSTRWYLEPARIGQEHHREAREDFGAPLSPEWSWRNGQRECACVQSEGLVIHAEIGRGLHDVNLEAPCLLRPASGDVAVQVACLPGGNGAPAAGGLVLWKDVRNFVRLDRGSLGENDVAFGGSIRGSDVFAGRGRLPADRILLRVERSRGEVRGLCSADGQEWYGVGTVDFTVDDPLEIGLFVDGAVRPEVYPLSFANGSTVRFEKFEVWR